MSALFGGGLEAAGALWRIRNRSTPREGVVRAAFAHAAQRYDVSVDLNQGRARADRGRGHASLLILQRGPGEAADPRAWTCDCPAGAALGACLHATLVTAALVREVESLAEDDVPDARFARGVAASSGLVAAAEKYRASIDKLDDSVRVGDAIVDLRGQALGCDCPLGDASTCLHRVVVDAWARGARPARPTSGVAISWAGAIAQAPTDERAESTAGERLPDEDVVRFAPVIERVESLSAEMICFGLQRTSAATLERIFALITEARALGVRDAAPRHAGLGRLIRALERLVELVRQFQERVVTTSELDVVRELSIMRNIIRAIRANAGALPLSEFAGATQMEYEAAPALDVQGIGFEVWTTLAGFGGVTAYVADLRTGQILTRTNALALADLPSGWPESLASQAAFAGNSTSFADVARGRFLLSGAQIAREAARLSGSSKTQLAKRDPIALDDPKLRRLTIAGVADALRIARRLGFDPLGRPPASPPMGLVPVESIEPAEWDRRTQTLRLAIKTKGARLPVAIGYRDSIKLYVDNLERLSKAETKPAFILCRVRAAAELGLEPITAYYQGTAKDGSPRLERKHLTFKELDVS